MRCVLGACIDRTCLSRVPESDLLALQDGDVQLWGVEAGGFVDSLSNADEDAVTTACPLQDEPYVLLGCKSGKLQAVALLGSSGGPAGGAREACSLGRLGYEGGDLPIDHAQSPCEPSEMLCLSP